MTRKKQESRRRASARIEALKGRIATLDLVCSGTLLERTKLCGKPGCHCAVSPKHRHGPYWEWGRMHGGKLVHRTVSAKQAQLLRKAIANYKAVRSLLRAWETETVRIMAASDEHN